jgi:catechol 2,3-dioxygenase-like lactoylglutathione lyase family enzyme
MEGSGKVSEALKSVGAITLFVEDLPAARSFYERVFGRTPAFGDDSSAAFKFDNTLVNLVDTRAAGVVIEPVAVASPSAGSRFLLTIWVDDVDAACAGLAKRGVALLNGPVDRPWGMRTASFTDPAGHIWEIAQDLDELEGS